MAGLVWYPGKRELMRRAFAESLVQTAQDVLDDLRDTDAIPHAETATRGGRQAGKLEDSGMVDAKGAASGRVRVVFNVRYATRVYFHPEWQFRTGVNPNARGLWFEPYLARGYKANFAYHRYRQHLREHGRGWLF